MFQNGMCVTEFQQRTEGTLKSVQRCEKHVLKKSVWCWGKGKRTSMECEASGEQQEQEVTVCLSLRGQGRASGYWSPETAGLGKKGPTWPVDSGSLATLRTTGR